MRDILVRLALVLVLAYLLVCAAVFAFQRSLIYFPQPASLASADSTLKLVRPDATVVVTMRERAAGPALIYFGGNAEDVSINLPSFAAAFPEHAIYLMHYRGYGASSGSASEEANHGDALALFDLVRAKHAQIAVLGRSLGSGVAVRLASVRPAARLVMITPYDSVQEIAQARFPFLPVPLLLSDKYESWRHAQRVGVPTLVLAAEHDELIPRASSERLYRSFKPGLASFKLIPGTSHNTISHSPLYLDTLKAAISP